MYTSNADRSRKCLQIYTSMYLPLATLCSLSGSCVREVRYQKHLISFFLKPVLVELVNNDSCFLFQFFHRLCCCLVLRGLIRFFSLHV